MRIVQSQLIDSGFFYTKALDNNGQKDYYTERTRTEAALLFLPVWNRL